MLDVDSVVLSTEPVAVVLPVASVPALTESVPALTANVPAETATETEPLGVWLANAVVKSTVPPDEAVPVTTRSAWLL